MLTRDDVVNAFDLLLGTVPDEATIKFHLENAADKAELSKAIIVSREFMNRLHKISPVHMPDDAPLPATGRFEDFERLADGVEGWFTDMSAALFDCLLSAQFNWGVAGNALEIGVAYGRSAILPALHVRSTEQLRIIDFSEPTLNAAVKLLRPLTRGRLEAVRASSFDIRAGEAERGSIRFAHIDGDHSYPAILNDMAIVDDMLCEEGICVLDDFFSPQYCAITMAAGAFMAQRPDAFRLIITGYNKGYFCRPSMEKRYLTFIRDELPAQLRARRQTEFTFWRMMHPGQPGGFGLGTRQYGRDFITLNTDVSQPVAVEEIEF